MENFGCRATQADGAAIERQLIDKGLNRASEAQDAEVVVLNTCTVTASADQDARASIRRIHRENPNAKIMVTGCYAQRAPEEIAALPGVSMVVGNSHKHQIGDIAVHSGGFVPLQSLAGGVLQSAVMVGDIFGHTELLAAPVFDAETSSEKTRPNLKVQDGCNNRCSFCIIPFVRGKSRSAHPDQVVEQVRTLGAKYREIVLSGINLGRWGRDFPSADPKSKLRLADLVRRLLKETPVERLRLSSVEPMDFSDDLLQLMAASPRIAKHVHAPLQSGSDTVLRRMHRKYRPKHYADRVWQARELMPECAVGADVMTGFPGETDAEFQDSYDFIHGLPFTYLHVFTYSERPGTPAADSDTQVPQHVRKERTRILRELGARKNLEFRKAMLGKTLSVVTLDNGSAISENYLKVALAKPREANQIVDIVVGDLTADGVCEAGTLQVLQ